ncbi:MAG: hypothetical protein ACOY4Q_01805 [Bacillota bacterium]
MKSDVSRLKFTVTRLEARMENEVIDKIRVLFDGYKIHDEKLDRIEQKVDALTKKEDIHDIEIGLIKKRLSM